MLSILSRACSSLLLANLYSMESRIGIRIKIVSGVLRLETVGGQPKMVMDPSSGSERPSTTAFSTGQAMQALVAGLTSAHFGLE